MHEDKLLQLTDPTGTLAVIAPELGGWLLRYARPTARHGLVEALHFSQAAWTGIRRRCGLENRGYIRRVLTTCRCMRS